MMTQFKRAMTELGIKVINANSPQAKGRIERLFGTLQDRLVKEMRLRNIKNTNDANRFLSEEYLSDHNTRFSIAARMKGDAHRPLTGELRKRLPSIFSVQSPRTVTNDFTLRFKSQWYQLAPQQPIAVYRGDTVTIEERLDGSIHVRLTPQRCGALVRTDQQTRTSRTTTCHCAHETETRMETTHRSSVAQKS